MPNSPMRVLIWCLLFSPLLIPLATLAQVEEAGGESLLEEVTVTVQKREQSLQDVGISVTAFSGDRLQAMGIDSVEKMQIFTPNLRIAPTFTGVPQYSIRGIGENSDTSALSSSPVAVHINEVAQPYPLAISNLLFDLQRVEVLRGPQGDLFGLNSTPEEKAIDLRITGLAETAAGRGCAARGAVQ